MAILDTVVIIAMSVMVGGIGIFAGVRLVVDETVSFENALLTAMVGAIVWGAVSSFVGFVPIVGPVLALVIWIVIINIRYPSDWGTAVVIGFFAWLGSVAVLYAFGTVGVISLSALGVPEL